MQRQRFAWKIFSRLLALQALLVVLAIAVTAVATRSFFLDPLRDRAAYAALIVGIGVAFLVFSAAIAWTFSSALGRLLAKAESVIVRDGSFVTTGSHELSELESSLDTIRRDLLAKNESLTVEREELATLMGAISDAILAIDPDGIPLFFNSRFAMLYGNESELRKHAVRLWEMFREPDILESYRLALREGKTSSVKATPFGNGDGSKRFFSLSISPLRSRGGEIYGAVGIFHDVTELKSAEQIRIDFVANVSHELRTPLTSIKGYTDTMIADVQSGRAPEREFLDIISRNVDRLMNLIGDLLDLSSLESTDVLQKTQIPLEEITNRVAKQLENSITAKNQVLDLDLRAQFVTADPKRVEQVLVNLLDNAHKYTPAGGRIQLRWEREGNDVLLKVRDNGPGIPPEHHGRLFERFYRVDKARSREQGGTGLGLAIVKHIMQRHDGAVWVESQVGQGATFICRFPS